GRSCSSTSTPGANGSPSPPTTSMPTCARPPAGTSPPRISAPGRGPCSPRRSCALSARRPAGARLSATSSAPSTASRIGWEIRARLLAVEEKAGFIPNVFMVLAHRPDEFRAFFAYHDALMLKEGGLSKGEREMIVVATSAANECHYCVIAHGALVRIYEKQPLLADQVATNYRKAD